MKSVCPLLPKYPDRAAPAISTLLSVYTDAYEVYVEDSSQINLYRLLLEAAISRPTTRFFPIPLNGRVAVIERARALSAANDNKRRLFLIDGDLEYVSGQKSPRIKNLYRVNAYCIENIICETDALIEVLYENCGKQSRQQIIDEINMPDLDKFISSRFVSLFVLFSVARTLAPLSITCSIPVARFFDVKNGEIREEQLRAVQRQLIAECVANSSWAAFVAEKMAVRAAIKNREHPSHRVVSGKNYVLPIVHNVCSRLFGYGGSRQQMARSLARHCNFQHDRRLRVRLRQAYGFVR
jgi:hypothetical protein